MYRGAKLKYCFCLWFWLRKVNICRTICKSKLFILPWPEIQYLLNTCSPSLHFDCTSNNFLNLIMRMISLISSFPPVITSLPFLFFYNHEAIGRETDPMPFSPETKGGHTEIEIQNHSWAAFSLVSLVNSMIASAA